jgi:hypothetical protein
VKQISSKGLRFRSLPLKRVAATLILLIDPARECLALDAEHPQQMFFTNFYRPAHNHQSMTGLSPSVGIVFLPSAKIHQQNEKYVP